jgi:hypothetical protein
VFSFSEKEQAASAHSCMYIRNGMTGLLLMGIHHLSSAASITLFTVHHFEESTGDINASPRCNMSLLVKI